MWNYSHTTTGGLMRMGGWGGSGLCCLWRFQTDYVSGCSSHSGLYVPISLYKDKDHDGGKM